MICVCQHLYSPISMFSLPKATSERNKICLYILLKTRRKFSFSCLILVACQLSVVYSWQKSVVNKQMNRN